MESILRFATKLDAILGVFMLATVITAVADITAGTPGAWATGLASIVVFGLLAWFTRQRQLLATWTMVLLLIVIGSGYLYDSFLALAGKTPVNFFIIFIKCLTGVYLTWGALIIHRDRHVRAE